MFVSPALFFSPFVAESASVGQHREAGKVITETGGRLPDSGRNWCVFCFGLGMVVLGEQERWRGGVKIVVGMSERQQIVLLICEVGGCVFVCVCVCGEEEEGKKNKKKTLSLTPDDIFGKHIKGEPGKERERCTGGRSGAASPCSAPEENLCITMNVCVVYVCFFSHKQTGGL